MRKVLLMILMLECILSAANAQEIPYRTCDTDVKWNEAVEKDPAALIRNAALRAFRQKFIASSNPLARTAGTVLYRIPVVFHVMHTYGPENISKAQILDAVEIMNQSFQKLNSDTGMVIPLFQPIFADCQIELVLANIDPNGNCTDGITRTYTPLTGIANDNVKALIDWPSDKYFNIWVVKNIQSGAAGYAYYPGISAAIDGVVIRHDYVGGIGTSSGTNYTERSLTHEVGHWLDLPHTWGSTNLPGLASNCGIDDGISDTPLTIGVDNFTCNTAQSTCGAIDNVQNYMDYASCHYMFTEGQKMAMHAALNSGTGDRNNLWTGVNLNATGTEIGHVQQMCTPVADFNFKKQHICAGNSVSFKDVSWKGEVGTRLWQFPGGTPATDTSANPVVSYTAPGVYDVTLTVSNAAGSDVLVRAGLVEVLPVAISNTVPFAEGFETIGVPSGEWSVDNPDNNNTWVVSSLTGASGSKSLQLNNQIGSGQGDADAVLMPPVNLTGVSAAMLSFKYAFAARSNADSSELRVFVSTNCGASWIQRLNLKGAALRTAPNTNGNFVPNAGQWTTQTVNFSAGSISGKPSLRVKFEFVNVDANNFYLDDINMNGVTGVNEVLAQRYAFEAYPNPSRQNMMVQMQLDATASVQLAVLDLSGRLLQTVNSDRASGKFQYEIDGSALEGTYLLCITVNGQKFTRRVAFIH